MNEINDEIDEMLMMIENLVDLGKESK